MTLPNSGSVLATLTELTQVNRTHALLSRVKDLSVNEFVCLLDFITAEFQQFIRAIDLRELHKKDDPITMLVY
jgi:adenylate cyclase